MDRDGRLARDCRGSRRRPDLRRPSLAGRSNEDSSRAGLCVRARAAAALSAGPYFTKGWLWGAAGHVSRSGNRCCTGCVRKERLRSNPRHRTAIFRTAVASAHETIPIQIQNPATPGAWAGGALPPRPPEIYRLRPIPEREQKRGAQGAPPPVLALSRRSGRVSASPYPPPRRGPLYLTPRSKNRRITSSARRP